jgi:hypothetical protein
MDSGFRRNDERKTDTAWPHAMILAVAGMTMKIAQTPT